MHEMENINFEYIEGFSKCEAIMNENEMYEISSFKSICNKNVLRNFDESGTENMKTCINVMKYISNIYTLTMDNEPTETPCLYMYYWIYNYLMENKKVNITRKLFIEFLKTYEDDAHNNTLCKNYKEDDAENILNTCIYMICIFKRKNKHKNNLKLFQFLNERQRPLVGTILQLLF
ncbi:variable surface protein [Plasmodium gonderi]|uniref:Variable surface protein n=1 Tax=Plasmodium gonderi TaxID=77519 RepID=A0A1Y1JXP3_PLAGO|nr:variable surface protein [Plasmodium gonderi]GAW84564.1 variable surface protein [Plasmodium gonderi]